MTGRNNQSERAAELRRQTEEIARKKAALPPERPATLSPEETQRTLYELRVHQIELEMQNEELRRVQTELETSRARYFDLYDLAPIGYFTLSEQGLILEANLTAAAMLGVARGELAKQPLSRFILKEDQDIYYLHRKRLLETAEPQACELRMMKYGGAIFWAHLEATAAEDADGGPIFRAVMSDVTNRIVAEETLRKAHHELEQRVADRTAELAETVEELHDQIRERIVAEQSLQHEHRTLMHLLQASDRERQAISLGIHDNLAQPLASATMHLEAAGGLKGRASKAAAKAQATGLAMLRESINEARRLISSVRPPILEDEGVEAAVAHLACECRSPGSPQVEFHIDAKFDRLTPSLESAIYRIAQQGLGNACRHSQSDRARIELVQQGDRLRIEIQDWGVGFDPQAIKEESFGLEEIREQARVLGGTALIESAPGHGTRIVVDLPLLSSPASIAL